MIVALAVCSTLAAVVQHAWFAPPGDQPLPLLLLGCAAAFVVGITALAPPILVGPAALAGFPLEAVLDLAEHGGHNLLPLELGFHVVYMALGFVAAAMGHRIRAAVRPARN